MDFNTWVRNIITCTVAISMLEILIPKSKLKTTVSAVLGILLTGIILIWPLSILRGGEISFDFPETKVEINEEEINRIRTQQIKSICEDRISEDIRDIIGDYKYNVDMVMESDGINVQAVNIIIYDYDGEKIGLKEKIYLKTHISYNRLNVGFKEGR